jgi:hypothetical protein
MTLKRETNLSEGNRRKPEESSDYTVAASEIYIRMPSGEGSRRRNKFIILYDKGFYDVVFRQSKFCLEVSV